MSDDLSVNESGVDFSARYTVDGYRGVAFYLTRYATKPVPVTAVVTLCQHCDHWVEQLGPNEWFHTDSGEAQCDEPGSRDEHAEPGREITDETGELEEVEDRDWVIAIMVGDDREHLVEVTTLTKIGDLDYCAECGQIGCTHDGRERD